MTDYTELKRLAVAGNAVIGDVSVDITISSERGPNQSEIDAVTAFVGAATPAAVLALIAENEALAGVLRRFVNGEYEQDENQAERHMYFTEAQSLLALVGGELKGHTIVPDSAIKALNAERDQLKAESDRLTSLLKSWRDQAEENNVSANQLRAEVAGLKTGYEAYERVNAELKAELEALRKRIDDMSPFKGAPFTGPDLKCLVCGGYHYGLSGLPCPKFRNTAQSDLPETRSGQIGAPMGKGEQS